LSYIAFYTVNPIKPLATKMLRKKLLSKKGAILSLILLFGIIAVIFLWNYEFKPEEKQQICQPLFLEYTFGDIDSRFNLKNEELIEMLKDSEKIWEEPLEYDVLRYNPEAYFKINFVFDERQEYDMLEQEYSELQYSLNFSEKTKKETAKIQKEMAVIEAKQDLLSDKIYSSGEKYEKDEAYTQGDYTGNSINIYNFDDRDELVTLLAHEFGHALEVPDNQDPDSIMCGINSGHFRQATPDDLEKAKDFCVSSE
jgi:hypothetical protein